MIKQPRRFLGTLVAALVILPFLPVCIERTMTRSFHSGSGGDTISWGWELLSLIRFLSDYRYIRPEQQPAVWLTVNIALLLIYAIAIAVAADRVLARFRP